MIDILLQNTSNFLPLLIEKISWDGDTLILGGDGWNFSTLSAWRIIDDSDVQVACWGKGVDGAINELVGLSIIEVGYQGISIEVDPLFKLSDGRLLEVFSTDTIEPWVMQLPDGKIYVGGA